MLITYCKYWNNISLTITASIEEVWNSIKTSIRGVGDIQLLDTHISGITYWGQGCYLYMLFLIDLHKLIYIGVKFFNPVSDFSSLVCVFLSWDTLNSFGFSGSDIFGVHLLLWHSCLSMILIFFFEFWQHLHLSLKIFS